MVGTKIRRLKKCWAEYKTIPALKFVHSQFLINSIAHRPCCAKRLGNHLFNSKVPCDTRRTLVSGRLSIIYFGFGSRRLSYILLVNFERCKSGRCPIRFFSVLATDWRLLAERSEWWSNGAVR